jgi:hypothetical protein
MARVRLLWIEEGEAERFNEVNDLKLAVWWDDNRREVYRELERRKAARAHSAGMEGDAT